MRVRGRGQGSASIAWVEGKNMHRMERKLVSAFIESFEKTASARSSIIRRVALGLMQRLQ